jgi:two-component system LytT family sensor kinase
MHAAFQSFTKMLHENDDYRFWLCQLIGWSGYALMTFLSITLIDNNVSWPHIGHICLSSLLGITTSWPLRNLYNATFDFTILRRLIIASVAIIVLSAIWTVLRKLVFAWIVDETVVWDDINYWYFGDVFVFLCWSVLYYGLKYYDLHTQEHQELLEESAQKQQEQYRRLQAESSFRDAQLQMLRYQLNPHFLFNTLNGINALVKLKENNKAQEMLQLLSKFLRHSLEQEGINNVSLADEIDSMMLYLNIEKIRFEERLNVEFEIEPQARQALVPPFILQPIVENSMKYAIEPSENGGTVRVAAAVVENELQLNISDTGPGLDITKSGSRRGVGLSNTLNRLETLYDGKYSFETIDNSPSGLIVRIRLPFQTAQLNREKSAVAQ